MLEINGMFNTALTKSNHTKSKKVRLTDGGKILNFNGTDYIVKTITSKGVTVEFIENSTQIQRTFYWDEINGF